MNKNRIYQNKKYIQIQEPVLLQLPTFPTFLFQTLLQLIQSATLFDKKTLLHHVVNHKKEVRKTKMGTKKSSQTENLARHSAKKSPKVLQE